MLVHERATERGYVHYIYIYMRLYVCMYAYNAESGKIHGLPTASLHMPNMRARERGARGWRRGPRGQGRSPPGRGGGEKGAQGNGEGGETAPALEALPAKSRGPRPRRAAMCRARGSPEAGSMRGTIRLAFDRVMANGQIRLAFDQN